ncbi:hypothetical protein ACHAWF_012627 [Thalassiosira exigua]
MIKSYSKTISSAVIVGFLVGFQHLASPMFFNLPTVTVIQIRDSSAQQKASWWGMRGNFRKTHGDSALEKADPWKIRGSMSCHPENATDPQGLYFVSIPKSDNGYWRYIFYRARRRMKSKGKRNCFHLHFHHPKYRELELEKRVNDETFVVSFMREPRDHSIRTYAHARATIEARDAIDGVHRKQYQTYSRFLEKEYKEQEVMFLEHEHAWKTRENSSSLDHKQQKEAAKHMAMEILGKYGFVGIVERPSESLVALQFILNWTANDILYIPTQNIGTISYFTDNNKTCHSSQRFIFKNRHNERVYESWKPRDHRWSLALYQHANKKLNATIKAIGRVKFQEALTEHERLMDLVRKQCLPLFKGSCYKNGERARSSQEVKPHTEAWKKCMESL